MKEIVRRPRAGLPDLSRLAPSKLTATFDRAFETGETDRAGLAAVTTTDTQLQLRNRYPGQAPF